MIAKVCDRESRRDTWFENRLVFNIADLGSLAKHQTHQKVNGRNNIQVSVLI